MATSSEHNGLITKVKNEVLKIVNSLFLDNKSDILELFERSVISL